MISKKGELVKLKCKKCGEIKGSKYFHSYNKSYCKPCLVIRTKEWKIEHAGYDNLWRKKNPDKTRRHHENRRNDPMFFKYNSEYKKKWIKLHPKELQAERLVSYAIQTGRIERQGMCEGCKEKRKTVAHHENYDFPFDITWLCYSCHGKLHHKKRRSNEQLLSAC